MITKVDRNYLEINSIKELNYSKSPNNKCELFEINPPDFQINKFFYKIIGKDHYWKDRLILTDKQWINYVKNPNLETWVLKYNDELIGYYEKENHIKLHSCSGKRGCIKAPKR